MKQYMNIVETVLQIKNENENEEPPQTGLLPAIFPKEPV
jgi:hypothetical protein